MSPVQAEKANGELFSIQVRNILLKCSLIKVGSSRKELLKYFIPVGLSSPKGGTFKYKTCDNIMVDVVFKTQAPNNESSVDTIQRISQFYLSLDIID
jgi:hypothetical protein